MTNFTTFVNGTDAEAPEVNANFKFLVPIGGIISWAKTFNEVDSGTTDSTTANKLIQSGQNFTSTVNVGDCVYNSTDDTFAYITAIDSDTTLSIDSDIMVSGESYNIFRTPALDGGWVECNGQVLSDSDSVYNGATMPNLNGSDDSTKLFLRGAIKSGAIGSTYTHRHDITITGGRDTDGAGIYNTVQSVGGTYSGTGVTQYESHIPPYFEVVFIMRVK